MDSEEKARALGMVAAILASSYASMVMLPQMEPTPRERYRFVGDMKRASKPGRNKLGKRLARGKRLWRP